MKRMLFSVFSVLIIFSLILLSGCVCPPSSWDGPSPPWCEKTIAEGTPAKITFWVTVPYTSVPKDMFILIDGKEPIKMNKSDELSWNITLDAKGDEKIIYKYLMDSSEVSSEQFMVKITKPVQFSFDAVTEWNEISFNPNFSKDFVFSINMMDTWGRNYNFNMLEDTRNKISESFTRVKNTGAKEVYIHDFLMAVYENESDDKLFSLDSQDYEIKGDIFENDFRDQEISAQELIDLATKAHANGLKIGWRTNFTFFNIGKLIGSSNITQSTNSIWEEFNKPKSKDWVENYLTKWESAMLDKAEKLNKAGFDIMILTPWFMTPSYSPEEEFANQKWKEIIKKVKNKFNGKVGVLVDKYGFLDKHSTEDWSKYDFYKEADLVYYSFDSLISENQSKLSFNEMKEKLNVFLDSLNKKAKSKNIKLSIIPIFYSCENCLVTGGFEIYDVENPSINKIKKDWQHQANAYELLFQAAENKENIERIVSFGYWWDDAMNPDDTKVLISNGFTIRNKSAEAVFKKWAKAFN